MLEKLSLFVYQLKDFLSEGQLKMKLKMKMKLKLKLQLQMKLQEFWSNMLLKVPGWLPPTEVSAGAGLHHHTLTRDETPWNLSHSPHSQTKNMLLFGTCSFSLSLRVILASLLLIVAQDPNPAGVLQSSAGLIQSGQMMLS